MNELFLKILNMSISAGWLILAVLVFRLILKKAPKWVNVVLWGIVALRLMFPFSIESALSLIPSAETVPLDIGMAETPAVHTGIEAINRVVNPVISRSFAPEIGYSANPLQLIIPVLAIIWMAGMAAMLVYTAVSYWRLRRKVSTAIPLGEKTYQSENVSSPFVLGLLKPRIYLPFAMEEQDLCHVLAHERAHIRRKDHWWKPLGFLLLTVYWFNPLMWLGYVLLCRDIELACDEKVIRELGNEERADYTQALLSCSVDRRIIAACPLAFGEVGVKERVRSVMHYKKPAFWLIVAAVALCIGVAVGFLTDPVKEGGDAPKGEEIGYVGEDPAGETAETVALKDAAYYMELTVLGKEFREMESEKSNAILEEYGALLENYTLLARESTDHTAAYILGYYNGAAEGSPFNGLHTMGVWLSSKHLQLLYRESDTETVELALANGEAPEVGYAIEKSNVYYADKSPLIMIQPCEKQVSLVTAYHKYLSPGGRDYIADAVARGIALDPPEGPYLTVYLISEKYGEISEYIPLTEEEAAAILAQELQTLEAGHGLAAGICIDGESTYFTEMTGIPPTVITLAEERCGYRFGTPEDITDTIVEAKLDCSWLDEPLYAKEDDLARLREILVEAEFGYVGGCGYGAKLTLRLAGGEEVIAFKGCDGCDSMVFGSYGGYFIGDSENTEFWEIFGLDVETKEPLA